MVATRLELLSIIAGFVQRLEATGGLRVHKVILYGSYARGWPHRWSDIDLVVLSDGFKGMPHEQRVGLLAEAVSSCDRRLEPLAHTPREYRRAGPASFLGEVKRTGRVVYEAP